MVEEGESCQSNLILETEMGTQSLDAGSKQSSLTSIPHFCQPQKARDLGFQR